MMEEKIKILHLENESADAGLIAYSLKRGRLNFEIFLVDSKRKFVEALNDYLPDLILCDNSIPSFDAHDALNCMKETALHIPFVLVTGSMTEEYAVEIMREGADDYLFKDRLSRLPEAIIKALEKAQLKKKQRETDNLYRALIDNGSDIITLRNTDGQLYFVSPSATRLTGYSNEELLASPTFDLIHPDDLPGLLKDFALAIQQPGRTFFRKQRYRHKNGSYIWCEGTLSNMLHEPGVNAMVSNFRDITEKRAAEIQREFDNSNLSALINNTRDLMWSVDTDFNLITSNRPFDEMSKANLGRVIDKGSNVLAAGFTPEMLDQSKQQYERAFAGEAFTHTKHFTSPFEFWIEISYYPFRRGGQVIGTACQSRDVSHSKKVEQLLRKSETFNIGVLNSLSSHIAVLDARGRIIADNVSWELYGLNNGESSLERIGVGSNYFDVCEKSAAAGDVNASRALKGIKGVLFGAKSDFYFEYPCHSPSKRAWFGMRAIKFENDEPLVVVSHMNITERKLAEYRLIKSEARLKEAQAIGRIGNWEVDLARNRHIWSEEIYKIYGIEKGEIEPSSEALFSFIHPNDAALIQKMVQHSFNKVEDSVLSFRFIKKDGSIRHGHVEWRFEFDKEDAPRRLYGILQDVTETKEAELKLLQTLKDIEDYKYALDESSIVAITDRKGIIKYANDNFCRISKYSREELIGQDHRILNSGFHSKAFIRNLWETITNGNSWRGNIKNIAKDGSFYWVDTTIVPFLDSDNLPYQFVAIRSDITERKKTEAELDNTLIELEERVEERTRDLSTKNKNITDSINYAKRIQVGLFSPYSSLSALFSKSFILSKPQNIVSGDFLWCCEKNNKKLIVVADCTGHGVPGALMSIIGNNLLNGIIVDDQIYDPSEILRLLDTRLQLALKGDKAEIKDGMDIALCVVDSNLNQVFFAGAYRPLFVTDQNDKIYELAGNPFAIGGEIEGVNKRFKTECFPLVSGKRIYLTSDGYYSQFGGALGKKFMKKHFRETLEELQKYPIEQQKNRLDDTITAWAGENEQVDDIMVVGIEL